MTIIGSSLRAEVTVRVRVLPDTEEGRTSLDLDLCNSFESPITGARAAVFLMEENGKVHGRQTVWLVGGPQADAAGSEALQQLEAQESISRVVTLEAASATAKPVVVFTRLALEGKQVHPRKNTVVELVE